MLITFIWLDSLWNLMLMLCCWHLCFEALTLQAWHTIHTCFNAAMPLAKPTMKSLLKVALNQSCHCITHWNESISLISWFWNGSHNWQCSVSQTLLPSPNFNHAIPTLKATAAATAIWHRPFWQSDFSLTRKIETVDNSWKKASDIWTRKNVFQQHNSWQADALGKLIEKHKQLTRMNTLNRTFAWVKAADWHCTWTNN